MDEQAPPGRGPGGAPFEPTALKTSDNAGPSRANVRFTPGSMLGDRYRIVALLGKGGMGEVYRAEDTRLGQQVALKFLPAEFASDPQKLPRLYDEVRLGRQVSHPNVCRLYDVAEIDGHHFIAMEYIDGEDLASLLRRIGKLPHEKALDLARDLCAGLAAAHGLGIIHRDLKPANVMIDGRGDARITDFGLAALAEDLEARREIAGTPAYMAPEQLSGSEVTQKTDLYALGLLLYEMFTGKRLFEGATFGEIVSQHTSASSHSISRETSALDPAVQRVIVRCLEQEPAKRPASIHSVIAALPGGDPLQAAIDAGETPSPEMIAAAGSSGELRPAVAWPLLIVALLLLVAAAALSPRVRLYGQTDLSLEGPELAREAREILETAGVTARPRDSAWEFGVDRQHRLWKREQNRIPGGASPEAVEKVFSPLIFGYRESPSVMASASGDRVSGFRQDPPLNVGGMGQVVLDPDGRLRKLIVVAPEETAATAMEAPPRWDPLFEATGLQLARAKPVEPRWRPPVGADVRYAWLVPVEGLAEPARVEGATLGGRIVWLEAFAPWRRPAVPFEETLRPTERLADLASILLFAASLAVGGVLAVRNVRRGRGNRQGAWRIALFVALMTLISEAFQNDHFTSATLELQALVGMLSLSAFIFGVFFVWYLALEPYLRRRWPRTLISWNRVLQRRWLDPLVGRDILIGVLAGTFVRFFHFLTLASPAWLGWKPPIPHDNSFLELSGWKQTLNYAAWDPAFAVMIALVWMVVLLLAHLLFRRRWIAVAIVFVLVALSLPGENYPILEWTSRFVRAGVFTAVLVRYGLLSATALTLADIAFDNFPVTLDPTVWYFDRALLALVLVGGLAVFGFIRSLGAQALFGEPVLED